MSINNTDRSTGALADVRMKATNRKAAMTRLPDLTVAPARITEREAISRLLQLYLHDFSEFTAPGDDARGVDQNGLFAYPPFDSYWQGDEARAIHLFRVAGDLAGFAFVNDWSPSGQGVDHALAEFFVLRPYRRAGIGWDASTRLFAQLPGIWEVGVLGHNFAAVNFWRTALRADPISDLEELQGPKGRWDGTVFRFRT